jgi:hypothetical protein
VKGVIRFVLFRSVQMASRRKARFRVLSAL